MPAKAAFLTLEREFAGGLTDPAEIVIIGDVGSAEAQAAVTKLQDEIAQNPIFSPETQVATAEDGSAVKVSAFFKGETQNDASFAAIDDLRDERGAGGVRRRARRRRCTSAATRAIFLDFLHVTDTYQWIVLAFVLGLSFLLLMVVFRSLVLPIKAILMNLLSVGAAYGAVTLVFQKGVGIGFFNSIGFNFHQSEAIEAWLPLFLFSILFGLSMDYHVFLLHADPRGIRQDPRQHGGGRVRPADDGGHHHRRGDHHGRRVHRVRVGTAWVRCSRWASAWRSRCSWTPRSCGRSWCRRACGCWATGTGTCRAGWSGCRSSTSRATSRSTRR